MNTNIDKRKGEIPWLHLVRAMACLMVVCLHVVSAADAYPKSSADGFFVQLVWVATRPCVPLFFMITGFLILPYRNGDDLMAFYRKRIPKVLFPLLIWGGIYALLPYFLGMQDVGQTVAELVLAPIKVPERIGGILWYLFILTGIYLVIPFFSERIYGNKHFLRLFLCVWMLTMIVPVVKSYYIHNQDILGYCHYIHSFDMFLYFSGYIGYLFLGYSLKKYDDFGGLFVSCFGIMSKKLTYVVLLTATFAVCMLKPVFAEYFLTFGTAVMAACMFEIFKKTRVDVAGKVYGVIKSVSSMSFGIYLCHMVVLKCVTERMFVLMSAAWYNMLLCMALTFLLAYLMAMVISKVPVKRFIIG